MKDGFKQLNSQLEHKDAVISLFSSMFKVGELVSFAEAVFLNPGLQELDRRLTASGKGQIPNLKHLSDWLNNGIHCELLSPVTNKGWQKGKIRIKITLEFCPDEPEVKETPESNKLEVQQPESPLDDIRRVIFENNQ